jgi:hypothetical protein
MDAVTVLVLGFSFAGAKVAHKMADLAVDSFWKKGSGTFKRLFGADPEPAEFSSSKADAISKADPTLLADANSLLGNSSALRRARRLALALTGTRILWVDDHPENNVWERHALESLGVTFLTVERTETAEASLIAGTFDLVISDIARYNGDGDGILGLPRLKAAAPGIPIVLYVGVLNRAGTPPGAFGITNDPEELFHFILDVVDRTRVK